MAFTSNQMCRGQNYTIDHNGNTVIEYSASISYDPSSSPTDSYNSYYTNAYPYTNTIDNPYASMPPQNFQQFADEYFKKKERKKINVRELNKNLIN